MTTAEHMALIAVTQGSKSFPGYLVTWLQGQVGREEAAPELYFNQHTAFPSLYIMMAYVGAGEAQALGARCLHSPIQFIGNTTSL